MQNYFRITAYHPTENISVIMDSYGKFEKLWQFSAYMVSKGFEILDVGDETKFEDGNMPKVEKDNNHIFLRAYNNGKPTITNNQISIEDKTYSKI